MTDYRDLQRQYLAERERYKKLAEHVVARLRVALREEGLAPPVTCRVKNVTSFVRKAIRKGYTDPMSEITDKAGIRILVANLGDREKVRQVVRATLHCTEEQDKADLLKPSELGYLGVHFLASVPTSDLDSDDLDLEDLVCEVQVHTRAQSVWADLSHMILYKPIGIDPSPSIQRRVMRLMALVEYFDLEIDGADRDMRAEPGYQQSVLLGPLEREFTSLTGRDYDRELSMYVLSVVSKSYDSEEIAKFSEVISAFAKAHRDELRTILDAYGKDHDAANPLLFQPEMIAIFERLIVRPALLKDCWSREMEPRLLESLAAALGKNV